MGILLIKFYKVLDIICFINTVIYHGILLYYKYSGVSAVGHNYTRAMPHPHYPYFNTLKYVVVFLIIIKIN